MNKIYYPLHNHTMYSMLDGISKPEQITNRLTDLGLPGIGITEHGNLSSSIQMLKQCKKTEHKLIIGCELYISEFDASVQNDNNRKLTHILVLSKGDAGWKDLVQLTSESNEPKHFYYKPRLSIEQLKPYLSRGNLICFGGHWGSTIANYILDKDGNIDESGIPLATKLVGELKEILKDDFYLEAQLIDYKSKPLVDIIRKIAKDTNTKIIGVGDSHYAYPDQHLDHQVALATNLNKSIYQCTDPSFGLSGFFLCKEYYIHSYDQMIAFGNTEEELENTLEVAGKCSEYKNILGPPKLPPFETPNGESAEDYLLALCKQGWDKKILNKITGDKLTEYSKRLHEELGVLQGAGLSSYFLIVQDILNFVNSQGWLPGPGRGSAAGCLVSYLIGITSIDPLKYDLLFSRFYNAGRNTTERVSMPDIDVDVPASKRDKVIQYIKNKYGEDKVAQMITIQTMKGRGALKDVLRAHSVVSPTEMNLITKHFPEEAKIADELQIMKEEEGESSIIRWTLENDDKGLLKEWCSLDEDGNLVGPLAKYFEQAIRLEGTKAHQSKHASGILISSEPLSDSCPMVYDSKTKSMVAGLEMNDVEEIGMIKYDILGLSLLDKIAGIADILRNGDISE